YRSALGGNRDIHLLTSKDRGKTFQGALVHELQASLCPMSTLAFLQTPSSVMTAWDTDGQIYFATIKPGTTEFSTPQSAPRTGKMPKHPALAINSQGAMILVWTEGTGWQKGGALVWQVYDKSGKPTQEQGRVESGIPVWGLPTVMATDAGFTILH